MSKKPHSSGKYRSELEAYEDDCFRDLRKGYYKVQISDTVYRCPYCRKEDYNYRGLLQHARQGSSSWTSKQKASHLALERYMKKYLDVKDRGDQVKFVWPSVGIVANLQRKLEGGSYVGESGKNLKEELTRKGFNPRRVIPLWNWKGHSGFALVEFNNDWTGFKNAMEFENDFEISHRGKKDYCAAARQLGDNIYGWVAREDDYYQNDIVGDRLRGNGDLKSVSEKQVEDNRRNKMLVSNLKNTLEYKSKGLKEMKSKYQETSQTIGDLVRQEDAMLKYYNEEMNKMQKNARDHIEKIFLEHERATSHLEAQKKRLEQQQKQPEQREVNNENERKRLRRLQHDMEMNKQAASEQKKADENVLRLAEDQKRAKEELHKQIIELQKKLDAKQTLELEIECLRGTLQLMKHTGEGVEEKVYRQKMEDLKEKEEELEAVENLNQTLIIKTHNTNDEFQEARKVLIQNLKDEKTPLLCVKRMGELSKEPFLVAAKRKFPDEEASVKGMELCSLWEDYLRDPSWHPFKRIAVEGNIMEICDEKDEKLKRLKEEDGDEVFEAVKTAVTEMNEYNPSGSRCVIPELWNKEQKRKATLKEGVACLLNVLSSQKSKAHTYR